MDRSYEIVEQILGGPKIVGGQIKDDFDLVKMVRQGLPTRVIRHLVRERWFRSDELYHLVITRRTLDHRVEKHQPLSPEQSDRLARVVRVVARAVEVLGSTDKAQKWLRHPTQPLGGEAPLNLLDSDAGAKAVENLLGRVEHGIAA